MKKTLFRTLLFIGLSTVALQSCTTLSHSMREPNSRVQFSKSDFTLSDQVGGEATTTKILNID